MENILVVEDDWELNRGICLQLQKEGYASASAHAFWEAQDLLFKGDFQLVLLDVNLPDQEGFDLPRWMKGAGLPVTYALYESMNYMAIPFLLPWRVLLVMVLVLFLVCIGVPLLFVHGMYYRNGSVRIHGNEE